MTREGAATTLGTRLYVNLAFAEHAEEVAALDVDGVGLLRAEFMVTDALAGVHPRLLLDRGDQKTFVDAMASSLLRITRAFAPRRWSTGASTFAPTSSRTSRAASATSPRGQPNDRYRGCYAMCVSPTCSVSSLTC